MRFFCYVIAALAITIPLFWGNPMQTAFPPTMKDSEKIVEEVRKTAKPFDSPDRLMVAIDSDLLRRLTSIALLSRKELQRANRDEAIYIGMLLAAGISLMTFLIRTENSKTKDSIGIGTPLAERPSHTTDRTDRVTSGSAAIDRMRPAGRLPPSV